MVGNVWGAPHYQSLTSFLCNHRESVTQGSQGCRTESENNHSEFCSRKGALGNTAERWNCKDAKKLWKNADPYSVKVLPRGMKPLTGGWMNVPTTDIRICSFLLLYAYRHGYIWVTVAHSDSRQYHHLMNCCCIPIYTELNRFWNLSRVSPI